MAKKKNNSEDEGIFQKPNNRLPKRPTKIVWLKNEMQDWAHTGYLLYSFGQRAEIIAYGNLYHSTRVHQVEW